MSTASPASAPSTGYVCDTIPAARLATDADHTIELEDSIEPEATVRDELAMPSTSKSELETDIDAAFAPPRKLCVRHQRMADEGTNLKLQQVS
jgi:F-box/WD-40 domain protein MET30